MTKNKARKLIFDELESLIECIYKSSLKPILNFTSFKNYWELYIELGYGTGLYLLNRIFFQSLLGFYVNIKNQMTIVALASLRTSLEVSRIFRACLIDEEFREKYFHNRIGGHLDKGNYEFKQGMVLKTIEKCKCNYLDKDIQYKEIIIRGNKELIKGSVLSNYHSEMSNLCHGLNINKQLFAAFDVAGDCEKKRINISILDKSIEDIEGNFLIDYMQVSIFILTLHLDLFYGEQEIKLYQDRILEVNKEIERILRDQDKQYNASI